MAGELAGAAIGAVFGELFKAILDARSKAAMFSSVLKRLESTLKDICPLIREIEEFNGLLSRPEEEIGKLKEEMEKGKKLVERCSRIRWNYCMKPYYLKKLLQLDESLLNFFQIDMQAQQTRNVTETLVILRNMNGSMNKFKEPCAVPKPPAFVVGLGVPLGELKGKVLKDVMPPPVIVLSAPGGCGKTTLAKLLCQDEEVKGKFKNILFVTVSSKPNLMVIVQNLFKDIGLQVPEFQTDEDAINRVEQLQKQVGTYPTLLILDDVWSGSESLVDKFTSQLPDFRILVTSRSEFPRFGSPFRLKTLNDEDALDLFRDSAFPPDGNYYIPDEDLVEKILKRCKGNPLALTVVGRSLRGQPAVIWQRQAMEWSKGLSIFNSNKVLLDCLESSLNVLDNEVIFKECYMDLGSFPEDQRIPASALIDMWVELYQLEEDGISAMANLYEFSTRNLVNLVDTRKDESEVDGRYNEHFVLQHDLLRELAIHQSNLETIEQRKRLIIDISKNKFPKWWLEQKQQPFKARLLSLSTDETFSSKWYNLQLPEVEVLVLNIWTRNYTLPEFMEKIDKLKVLIVTNYGFFPTEISNFPLLCSLTNLKRIRLERISIPSLSMITVQLKNLLKVSLVMCNVGQAFRNCTSQISDALPNLMEIEIEYCNDLVELPDGLCDIVCLKKLSITNCHRLSGLLEGIGKLVNLEALRLTACTDLLALPDTIGRLSKLNILDISDCLSISKMPSQIGELCSLRKLYMRGCRPYELPPTIVNLEHLKVICDEETASLWEDFSPHPTNLRIKVLKEDINLNWLLDDHF